MVDIREINDADKEVYSNYVFQHSLGMFYYSWSYKCFLEGVLGCQPHYLIAEKEGVVTGIFPLMVSDGSLGQVWNALPFYGSHGAILSDDTETSKALYEYADTNFFVNAASYTVIQNPLEDGLEVSAKNTHEDYRIGQWTPLPSNEEDLLSLIDSSTRRNIKKAKKEKVTVDIDNESWEFLETVHNDNMRDIGGRAKSSEFFKSAQMNFQAGVDYNIYVAKIGEEKVSALLVFYYKDIVEYFTPVTLSNYRNSQPSAAIIYQAMLESANNGFKWWNWGGTWKEQDGVYKFKSKWGAQDKIYKYDTCVNNLDILKSSPEELLASYPDFYVAPFSALA